MTPRLGLIERLRDPIRRRRYLAAYCIALILALLVATLRNAHPDFVLGGPADFTSFYSAGKIICRGQTQALYDLNLQAEVQQNALSGYQLAVREGVLPFANPPVMALPFAIFCDIRLPQASAIWNILNLGLLLITLWLLWRHDGSPRDFPFGLTFLLALSFLPVFATFLEVQASFWLLLFFAVIYLALRARRDGLAGVALALVWLKPQLVLLFLAVLIAKRRWRALRSFVLVTTVLLVVSLMFVGRSGLEDYATLLQRAAGWDGMPGMYPDMMPNLRGTAFRLGQLVGPKLPIPLVQGATLVIAGILFLWTLRQWRGLWNPDSPQFGLKFSLTLAVALFVSPHVYLHDFALLVLVGFAVWDYAECCDRKRWFGLWMAVGHTGVFIATVILAPQLTIQLVAFYVLAFAVILARELLFGDGVLSTLVETEGGVMRPSIKH